MCLPLHLACEQLGLNFCLTFLTIKVEPHSALFSVHPHIAWHSLVQLSHNDSFISVWNLIESQVLLTQHKLWWVWWPSYGSPQECMPSNVKWLKRRVKATLRPQAKGLWPTSQSIERKEYRAAWDLIHIRLFTISVSSFMFHLFSSLYLNRPRIRNSTEQTGWRIPRALCGLVLASLPLLDPHFGLEGGRNATQGSTVITFMWQRWRAEPQKYIRQHMPLFQTLFHNFSPQFPLFLLLHRY